MSLIVRKYGGSSVATIEQIQAIAEQIKFLREDDHSIVVVVSAMGNTTNALLSDAHLITDSPDLRELDMLLSIGERKSISLMALALNSIGVKAVSFTGSQIGIITDNSHGNASILEIKGDRLKAALGEGKVAVIAGYQGVSVEKEITTLGRGGTDTTAVAVAAAINADRCELMKDVDGLYAIPPKYYKNRGPRDFIGYDEFLEIASSGGEILAKNAIQIAKKQNVKIAIGNTFTGKVGTIITSETQKPNSITQVVEQTCNVFREDIESTSGNYIHIADNNKHITIDLNETIEEKKHVLVTILGSDLSKLNLKIENIMLSKYSLKTDERFQYVFNRDDYEKSSKKLMSYLDQFIDQ